MSRYVCLGEIMLRLKSPGNERLFQSGSLEAAFGGGEANVAVSLANFGMNSAFVTALPDNELGACAIRELRAFGVDISQVVRSGSRVGIYFLEIGSNQRPSRVLYDRAGSSFSEAGPEDFDWEAIFSGASWFHITGISPALSESAANLSLAACKEARKRGVTVSCDFNYRSKLWRYGRSSREVMSELVQFVDVAIAGENDYRISLGIEPGSCKPLEERYAELTAAVMGAYPNLTTLATPLRHAVSADHNGWTGCMRTKNGFWMASRYEMTDIVDRVGGGDSFAAGLIYGLNHYEDRGALEFAVAASCLKHSIPGDFNRVSVAEVEELVSGAGSGNIQR